MSETQKLSKNFLEIDGIVQEALPSTVFRVKLDNGKIITAYLSGKMRLYRIKILPGDKVKLIISPYDLARGRIVYRY